MNAPAAVPPKQRKPDWIRVKAPVSEGYHATRKLMRGLNLATVCEEAACPNIGECWTKKHATVMILGDTCTRACAFCNVKTGMPRAVDPLEPAALTEITPNLRHGSGASSSRASSRSGFVIMSMLVMNTSPSTLAAMAPLSPTEMSGGASTRT
jgi:hypothetical protein